MADKWQVAPSADGKTPTLLANSTLDPATITAIASGQRPFPNYNEIPLTPERKLLHEVIIQTVTERRLVDSPKQSYEAQLDAAVVKAVNSPEYQRMASHGEINPQTVSAILDSIGLERLPTTANSNRVTVLMATAGPATGKSALVAGLAQGHPEIYRNSAMVNSDDYKLLLAPKAEYGAGYANAAHAESAYLSDEIMERLSHKIDAGRAPNVVLDVVTLSEQRIAFAKKSGSLIVATGTAPPEVTLDRAHQRGIETGRIVPSGAVLAGARAVAETTPRIFEHPNAHMELFDTNVPLGSSHKLVAKFEPSSRTLVINEPDVFVDFVERQNLNPRAQNASQLFTASDRSPATIAREMKAYTDRGVTLAFLNPQGELALSVSHEGVDQIRPLTSQRGNAFFAELAGAATSLAGSRAVEGQRAQVNERAPGEPQKSQTPAPIITSQGERAPQQNPVPLIVTQNERNQPPAPFVWRQPPPVEVPPERVTVPGKIGIGGAVAQLAIGPVYEATLSAANDGSIKDIARAGGRGLANAALPGVTDGFKNITENNQHQNWVDQTLNAGTTATQGVAVGSLAVAGGSAAAAPVTGGASLTVTAGSLVVAGVSGVANLGIGLVHDATYVTGISKQGGVVTGLINMGSQLLDSKAAHRAGDWMMGNDAKVQQELAAKGVRPNQLAGVDANKDGKVSAQEARDYLLQHHVPADQVNSLAAKPLADKLASAVAPQHPAPQAAAHPKPAMSDDMQRALQAALNSNLSGSILCDNLQHKPAAEWHAPMLPPKAQGTGVCR